MNLLCGAWAGLLVREIMQFSSKNGFTRLTGVSFLVAALSMSTLYAQDFEGKVISSVEIQYVGSRNVDEWRLRNSMSVAPGQVYHGQNLDNDIKTLYQSGLVEDVRFLAEPQGDKVRLIAEVKTRSALGGVGFEGNTFFSSKKLAKESKLKAGGALSDEEILTATRNIQKYYQGYGYPDVTVTHRFQNSTISGARDLVFTINEGGREEVRKIRFEGNSSIPAVDLKKVMKIKEKGIFSFLTKSGKFQSEDLDDDLEKILDEYRSKGFLRVKSNGVRRERVKKNKVDLVFSIQEGQKYTISSIGFGHMTVFQSAELYPALSLERGDAYSSKKVRDDITMIRDYYGSKGYADAAVTPEIRDAGPNQVSILYKVVEGSRFRVGSVRIQGNTKTKDKVIRREIPLKPGDWFNSVDLEKSKKRLDNMRYFEDVQVTGERSQGGYRDVDVLVEEGKTGSVGFGVGFSSIDSITGFVNLEQTNFDLFNPRTFTGAGQRFSMNLQAGSRRKDFSISLVEPWFMDQQLSLGGTIFYRDSRYFSDYYQQSNFGGSIFLRRPLTQNSSIRLQYQLEKVKIDVDSEAKSLSQQKGMPSELLLEEGDYLRSALSLNYLYDSRDSNVVPRSGFKLDPSLTLAGLGGDVNTVNFDVRAQKYWNLRWDTIVSINGELTTVDSTNGDRVPIFERSFLGGANTLRGFEFNDVGPRDTVTNSTIGGQTMGYAQAELTVPVIENLRFAVFYDAGFVNRDAGKFSPDDLYTDVGIGLRVKLPISPLPLAFDYAIPVSSPDANADKGGQFNFSLNYKY